MRALLSSLLSASLLVLLAAPLACSSDSEDSPKKEDKDDDDDDAKGDDASEPTPAACLDTTRDCDGDKKNGCETSISAEGNCGACGRACAPGSCINAKCVSGVVENEADEIVGSIATDGQGNVVYGGTRKGVHGVFTISVNKFARPLFQTGAADVFATSAVANASVIAFATYGTGKKTEVFTSPLEGGGETKHISCGSAKPGALAIGPTAIYWWDGPLSVARTTIAGTGVDEATCPAASTTTGDDAGRGIAVMGGNVYWIDAPKKALMRRADAASGTATAVAPGQEFTAATPKGFVPTGFVAADENAVYWTTETAVRKYDGAAVTDLATGLDYALALTVDDTYVYYTVDGPAAGKGSVNRVKKAGGEEPETIAGSQNHPGAIANDAKSVFFTTQDPSRPNGQNTVNRLAK